MDLKVNGKIVDILEVETGKTKADKTWTRQGFVVDTGEKYNPEVCFSLFGEKKIEEFNGNAIGQDVEVHFNVSSREFNKKWYHNLDAWKVVALTEAEAADAEEKPPF